MLGVQYFCNSKIPNRFSANSRCFKPKQTPRNSPLQNDKPQLLKESIADSGLVGHARLKRCLLACSNSEESTQIPSANLLEHALPLQSLTVRPGPSTLAIHTSDGPSPERSEGRRYSDSELHRRYNSVELGQSYSGTASSENKELSQRTRPLDKPSEIVSFSCLITSLGRDSLGRQQANVGSTGALIAENSRPSMLFTVPEEVFKKRVGKSGRVNCLPRSDKQKGETSVPPLGKTRSLQSIRRSRRSGSHPATSARFSKPLGKCERLGATRKICTSKSEHSVLDRCLQGGLGNSRSKQRKLSRSLDSERDRKPHKCPRIGNDTKGSIAARSIKPNSSSLVRQRGLNKCNSKTRISLPRAAKDNAKSTRGNVDKEHIHISKACSREEQCSSRRPIKNSRDCLRVADPRPRIQKIRAPPRNKTADRSICITSESQAGEVRLPFLLPNSVGNGRPEHRLESVSTDLSISPSRPLTNCSRETTFIPGRRNSYPQSGGALQENAPHEMSEEGVATEASSVPRGSGGTALASELRTLSRLEFLERCYHRAYGPEVAQDLVNSIRRSSQRQYESAWKRFQAWLPPSETSIDRALILKYLSHLGKSLAVKTVLVHRNALRLPLEAAFDIDFSHDHFSLLTRAQFLRNPPKQKIVPSWSLEEALNNLERKTLNPVEPLTCLYKALFLLAAASANRVSELAAICRKDISFRNNSVNLGFKPDFLFKNQSLEHVPSNLEIPALENSALCPISALRDYIAITSDTSVETLFVHPKTGNALNAGGISYWLVKAISWLLPNCKALAHDVRKLSTSFAWYRGVPASEIIKAGSWKTLLTFIKKYLMPTQEAGRFVMARSIF